MVSVDRVQVADHPVPFRWNGRPSSHPAARFWLECIRSAQARRRGGRDRAAGELFTIGGAWSLQWPLARGETVGLRLRLNLASSAPVESWHGRAWYVNRPEEVLAAAQQLVLHWPRGLLRVEPDYPSLSVAVVAAAFQDWLPPGVSANTPGLAEFVAWDAMRRIVEGQPAELAIREAHRLARGAFRPARVPLHPVWYLHWHVPEIWEAEVPPSLAWLFRPLEYRVACGDVVDGFRLGVLAGRWRDRIGRLTGVLAESGGARRRWLVVGRLASVFELGSLDVGVMIRMRAEPLGGEACGQAPQDEGRRRLVLWSVLRAWPEGQKMLIVPRWALECGIRLHGRGPDAWVAVRMDGVPTPVVAEVFRLACQLAGKGVDERRLRRWLESLTPADVKGLAVLRALAG